MSQAGAGGRPDGATLAAFLVMILGIGGNVVAGVYLDAIRPARTAGTAVSGPRAEVGEPPRAG